MLNKYSFTILLSCSSLVKSCSLNSLLITIENRQEIFFILDKLFKPNRALSNCFMNETSVRSENRSLVASRGVRRGRRVRSRVTRAQKRLRRTLSQRISSMTKTRVSRDTVPRLFDRCYFNTSTRIFLLHHSGRHVLCQRCWRVICDAQFFLFSSRKRGWKSFIGFLFFHKILFTRSSSLKDAIFKLNLVQQLFSIIIIIILNNYSIKSSLANFLNIQLKIHEPKIRFILNTFECNLELINN